MYCPRCRQEYQSGVTKCGGCGATLVEELPPAGHDEVEWVDLVTVLTSTDETRIEVARSLLESAGIACLVRGRGLQDLVGFGRMSFGFNPVFGVPEIQVRAQDSSVARELLAANSLVSTEPDGPARGSGTDA
jgi:hypothetical protein